ncbi:hypothetical protein [ANMV-1 virus]|nr:hypothetical protein [ANMV-1 virus]
MAQLVPAPGKLGASGKGVIGTDLLQDEAVTPAKQSTTSKLKRAHSNIVNVASANAAVAILYTSTAITVTAVKIYRITATVGDNCTIDVGINGNDDAIVEAAALAAGLIDTIVNATIKLATVEADKMVTASIHHVAGTSGTAVIAIEYYENG